MIDQSEDGMKECALQGETASRGCYCSECGSKLRLGPVQDALQGATFCMLCSEQMRRRRGLHFRPGEFVWYTATKARRHNELHWPAVIVDMVFTTSQELRPFIVRLFHLDKTLRAREMDIVPWCEGPPAEHQGKEFALALQLAHAAGAPMAAAEVRTERRVLRRRNMEVSWERNGNQRVRSKQSRSTRAAAQKAFADRGHDEASCTVLYDTLSHMLELLSEATVNEQRLAQMLQQLLSNRQHS